jgi:hypothetical protein
MYDFQFVIAVGDTVEASVSAARAFFKQIFPDPGNIRITHVQILPEGRQGKLVGQVVISYKTVLTIESPDEIKTDAVQPEAPKSPMKSV